MQKKQNQPVQAAPFSRGYSWLIYVVVILAGGLLTTFFLNRERHFEKKWIDEDFNKEYAERISVIRQKIEHHLEGIGALTSFFISSREVERQEFNSFSRDIRTRHPNIVAFNWTPRIMDSDRTAFEAAGIKEGLPAFQITEMPTLKKFVKAARRPEYYPIYFTSPSEGAENLVGFDLMSDPLRRTAMEKARDTGTITATQRISLLSTVRHGNGFLLVSPIYTPGLPVTTLAERRQAIKGFILNVCDIDSLVTTALATLSDEGIDVTLRDLTAPPDRRALCEVKSAMNSKLHSSMSGPFPSHAEILDVADRRWEIRCAATPWFVAKNTRVNPWNVLFTGSLLTGALVLYIHILRGRAADAQRHSAEIEHSQTELKESRERLAGIINTAGEAIISMDDRRNLILFNKGAEKSFGFTAGDVLGRPIEALFAPHSIQDLTEILRGAAEAAPEHPADFSRIIYGLRRDGSEFPAEASASRLMMAGVMTATLILRDKSDQMRLENQLRQSQKMEAIGQLAGGVAHDFNNILTVIIGNASILIDKFDLGIPQRELLSEIRDAGMRATAVTHQLLAFSRKQVVRIVTLDLNRIIGEMSKVLRRLIGEQIQLSTDLDADLGPIRADSSQIDQVIVNLVVNARDAIAGAGGAIRVRTRNVSLREPLYTIHGSLNSGNYVLLSVEDDGCGMKPDTIAHIFEPFFTTKENGKGTGLGLATVYGIVKQLGGTIAVDSTPSRGTAFNIYFPRGAADAENIAHATDCAKPGAIARATVLLAEDESLLRDFIRSMLQREGVNVLPAGDAKEALNLSKAHNASIDLLLTDVVMPGMSGDQLAEEILKQRPNIKVLFMSGYAKNSKNGNSSEFDPATFIPKPFTPQELVEKIQTILNPSPEPIEIAS